MHSFEPKVKVPGEAIGAQSSLWSKSNGFGRVCEGAKDQAELHVGPTMGQHWDNIGTITPAVGFQMVNPIPV